MMFWQKNKKYALVYLNNPTTWCTSSTHHCQILASEFQAKTFFNFKLIVLYHRSFDFFYFVSRSVNGLNRVFSSLQVPGILFHSWLSATLVLSLILWWKLELSLVLLALSAAPSSRLDNPVISLLGRVAPLVLLWGLLLLFSKQEKGFLLVMPSISDMQG